MVFVSQYIYVQLLLMYQNTYDLIQIIGAFCSIFKLTSFSSKILFIFNRYFVHNKQLFKGKARKKTSVFLASQQLKSTGARRGYRPKVNSQFGFFFNQKKVPFILRNLFLLNICSPQLIAHNATFLSSFTKGIAFGNKQMLEWAVWHEVYHQPRKSIFTVLVSLWCVSLPCLKSGLFIIYKALLLVDQKRDVIEKGMFSAMSHT